MDLLSVRRAPRCVGFSVPWDADTDTDTRAVAFHMPLFLGIKPSFCPRAIRSSATPPRRIPAATLTSVTIGLLVCGGMSCSLQAHQDTPGRALPPYIFPKSSDLITASSSWRLARISAILLLWEIDATDSKYRRRDAICRIRGLPNTPAHNTPSPFIFNPPPHNRFSSAYLYIIIGLVV